MDCINVTFQVLILYLSYARCDRWGKLDEGYIGLFFFFFWQFLLNLQLFEKLHSEEESLGFTPKGVRGTGNVKKLPNESVGTHSSLPM